MQYSHVERPVQRRRGSCWTGRNSRSSSFEEPDFTTHRFGRRATSISTPPGFAAGHRPGPGHQLRRSASSPCPRTRGSWSSQRRRIRPGRCADGSDPSTRIIHRPRRMLRESHCPVAPSPMSSSTRLLPRPGGGRFHSILVEEVGPGRRSRDTSLHPSGGRGPRARPPPSRPALPAASRPNLARARHPRVAIDREIINSERGHRFGRGCAAGPHIAGLSGSTSRLSANRNRSEIRVSITQSQLPAPRSRTSSCPAAPLVHRLRPGFHPPFRSTLQ